jgi:hypothetical protein
VLAGWLGVQSVGWWVGGSECRLLGWRVQSGVLESSMALVWPGVGWTMRTCRREVVLNEGDEGVM